MRLAALLLVLALAAVARADDTSPPLIVHAPQSTAERGSTHAITSQIEDESAIFAPTLYLRFPGTRAYTPVPMRQEADRFVATIAVPDDFDYWIEAYDEFGNGPSREGSPDRPHRVRAVASSGGAFTLDDSTLPDDSPVCLPGESCGPVPIYLQGWFLGAAGVVTAAVVGALVVGLTPDPVYRNTFVVTASVAGR